MYLMYDIHSYAVFSDGANISDHLPIQFKLTLPLCQSYIIQLIVQCQNTDGIRGTSGVIITHRCYVT